MERAERARAQAATARGASPVEQGETALLMAQADAAELGADRARATARSSASGTGRVEGYDSPARRERTAAALVNAGTDQETAAKRMRADVSQAVPAAAATAARDEKAPRARKAHGVALTPQRGSAER